MSSTSYSVTPALVFRPMTSNSGVVRPSKSQNVHHIILENARDSTNTHASKSWLSLLATTTSAAPSYLKVISRTNGQSSFRGSRKRPPFQSTNGEIGISPSILDEARSHRGYLCSGGNRRSLCADHIWSPLPRTPLRNKGTNSCGCLSCPSTRYLLCNALL